MMPGPGVFDFLIVGGGLAAAAAVDGIREVDPTSTIGLITEEAEPPYQRPPLSKEFLQYPDVPRSLLYVKPEGWFEEQERLELITRQKALVLDPAAMSVTTARGNVFRASRILIATGGRARQIDLPGNDLEGVFTLRSVDDSEAIRDAAVAGSPDDTVPVPSKKMSPSTPSDSSPSAAFFFFATLPTIIPPS